MLTALLITTFTDRSHRRGRGKDDSEEFYTESTRPSNAATLFDFLKTKVPESGMRDKRAKLGKIQGGCRGSQDFNNYLIFTP